MNPGNLKIDMNTAFRWAKEFQRQNRIPSKARKLEPPYGPPSIKNETFWSAFYDPGTGQAIIRLDTPFREGRKRKLMVSYFDIIDFDEVYADPDGRQMLEPLLQNGLTLCKMGVVASLNEQARRASEHADDSDGCGEFDGADQLD